MFKGKLPYFFLLSTISTTFGYDLRVVKLNSHPEFDHIFSLLKPYNINDYNKLRLGKNNDGGYVIPQELINNIDRCYTYGAGNDISFEIDLNKINNSIVTRVYDHTVNYPKVIKENIFFKKEGLGSYKTNQLNTFTNHIIENQDNNNKRLLLKLDIEGAEWNILDTIKESSFSKVVVLIIEFHWFAKTSNITLYKKILEKINRVFSVFHIHGNNCSSLLSINNKLFPNVIEVTYINNNYIKSKELIKTPLVDTSSTINCPPIDGFSLDFWLQ